MSYPLYMIPYGLSDETMTCFQQLDSRTFYQLIHIEETLSQISTKWYVSKIDVKKELQKKEEELRQLANKWDASYVVANNAYQKFLKKHRSVFWKEESISEGSMGLFDILTGRSTNEILERHLKKHKRVYDEKARLYAEVARYAQHSKAGLAKRIEDAKKRLRYDLEYQDEKARDAWEKQHREEISKLNETQTQILLKYSSNPGKYWAYYVKDIKITLPIIWPGEPIRTQAYEISGRRCSRSKYPNFCYFYEKLINKPIHIR